MNTTTSVVATGVIVIAGRWANDKPIELRIVIGAGAFALGLSLLSGADPELASKFALLVLIVALFRYGPHIMNKVGLTKLDPKW